MVDDGSIYENIPNTIVKNRKIQYETKLSDEDFINIYKTAPFFIRPTWCISGTVHGKKSFVNHDIETKGTEVAKCYIIISKEYPNLRFCVITDYETVKTKEGRNRRIVHAKDICDALQAKISRGSLFDRNSFFYKSLTTVCDDDNNNNSDTFKDNVTNSIKALVDSHMARGENFSKLTDGTYYFKDRNDIESFTISLPNLKTAKGMFQGSSIKNIKMPLLKLQDAEAMFMNSDIIDVMLEIPSLYKANNTFKNSKIENFKIRKFINGKAEMCNGVIERLTSAVSMFENTPLVKFYANMPKLAYAQSMFRNSKIEGFSNNIYRLVNAKNMFKNTPIRFFSCTTPYIEISTSMFENCKNLLTLDTGKLNFDSLIHADNMFKNSGLQKFEGKNIKMNAINSAIGMFENCKNLTMFEGTLDTLIDGTNMFKNDTNLTHFSSNLTRLVKGDYMFSKCKLDRPSVSRIVKTIRRVGKTENKSQYPLHIGVDKTKFTDVEIENITTILNRKGWDAIIEKN